MSDRKRWPRGGPRRPVAERFWEKVDRHGPSLSDDLGPCWLWLAALSSGGYGRFDVEGGRGVKAHRWAYESAHGPIPDGLQLDHLCRVRQCVNPDHLEPVTQRENLMRGEGFSAVNAAKTHCPHGHAFAEHGAISRQGYRRCNECCRLREAAKVAAMTEADRRALRDRQTALRYARLGRGPLKQYEKRF
jgi:hypothetical protein